MDTLRLCCVDPDRVPREVLEAHIELARTREYYREMEAEFVLATRSTLWTLARRRRFNTLLRGIGVPVLLLHGDADRLVNVAAARAAARANPTWRYEELPDVGHVPQLEQPQRTAEILLDWLAHEGAAGAEAARHASRAA
jgi:pimeloyl-ACP methyl ester carboxylesterase